jgi:hypothetical protein
MLRDRINHTSFETGLSGSGQDIGRAGHVAA